MKNNKSFLSILVLLVISFSNSFGQNPIIRNQFSADPSARVFNGKVYLYPSHDIHAPESVSRKDWSCMEDYHIFSSSNLTDWTDHGVIVSQNKVNRVDSLFFNSDGTIRKTVPTLRGVGLTDACGKIQIDRYSRISDNGISVAFLELKWTG